MTLPNLLVIGAMKCGTTSLHDYLGSHPQVFMSRRKELDFFVEEHNWGRGVDWYAAHFPEPLAVRGEASPRYSLFPVHAGVAKRIHDLVPDVKIVYLVRDPVERLISHYMHEVIEGQEVRTLEQVLGDDQDGHYVLCSRYWLQLEQYRPLFSPRQVLVIRQEDLLVRREATLRTVFRFLNVDETFTSPRVAIARHRTSRKRQLSPLGRALKGRIQERLEAVPSGLRSYLEWMALYPFSRSVGRDRPSASFRERLEELFREDTKRLMDTWEIARPDDGGESRR